MRPPNINEVRASSLPSLSWCTKMWHVKQVNDDGAGESAQTGNLLHEGAAAYANSKSKIPHIRINEGIAAIQAAAAKYPLGDVEEATRMFRRWVEKERTIYESKPVVREKQIEFWLPRWQPKHLQTYPEIAEASQEEQVKLAKREGVKLTKITGTLDEIRVTDDTMYVCDEKTGRTAAGKMIRQNNLQIAAYMVGASVCFPEHVRPNIKGVIRRTRDLDRGNNPYFYEVFDCLTTATQALLIVSFRLAEIDAGVMLHTPGEHCDYCPLGGWPECFSGKTVRTTDRVDTRKTSLRSLQTLQQEDGYVNPFN